METLATKADMDAAKAKVSGTLKLLHLRIAALVMGQKDIRYYLNGVQFEVHEGKALTLATDGHRLVVCRHLSNEIDLKGKPQRFWLERDQVAQVISAFKSYERTLPVVMFHLDPVSGMVDFTGAGNIRLSFPANLDTANTFPSWRRILTGLQPSGRPAQYDPSYLCDCAAIARMVQRKPVLHFEHNGDEPGRENHGTARVTFGDPDIVMALMPYRVGAAVDTSWLDQIPAGEGWR